MLEVSIIALNSHTLHMPPFNIGHITALLKILVWLSASFGVKIGFYISHQNIYIFFAFHSSLHSNYTCSLAVSQILQVHAPLRGSHSLFSGMFLLFPMWLAPLDVYLQVILSEKPSEHPV